MLINWKWSFSGADEQYKAQHRAPVLLILLDLLRQSMWTRCVCAEVTCAFCSTFAVRSTWFATCT